MTTLPEGTVTLLFTDIEGSTRLLQDLGEAYEGLLTDHHRLLRTGFETNGGVVVDTQGDAFFVAFRRAGDAVTAAVVTQHALALHDWSGSRRPLVRMAIHTGEPASVGEGFVGLSVHRAARICAAGHGGQVLLSATTRDLIEDRLPSGVALIDLGEHRLKDIDRPETIFQLVVDGIAPVLTPLNTLDGQAAHASPFAGRETELAGFAEDALVATVRDDLGSSMRIRAAARARGQDWRQFIHVPGHRRLANRLEGLGFSIHSTARIAPRPLHAELRALGRAFVTAARDARSADELLRREDQSALTRRLMHARRVAYSEHHLHEADNVAACIAALERLGDARREFEKEARAIEPRVRAIRARVFDARLDTTALDGLAEDMGPLREAADGLAARIHVAYELASRASVDAAPHA